MSQHQSAGVKSLTTSIFGVIAWCPAELELDSTFGDNLQGVLCRRLIIMRHADSSERVSQMKDNERRITDLGKQAAAQVHISNVAFAVCITFDL